ncbi:MAG: PQQ-like beta-propeller repeat protein [Ignavibacteriales bacterium]|nr:MAG: PQQ-like beta-propeller repeat protein [Ignavibacteriales bacterium]
MKKIILPILLLLILQLSCKDNGVTPPPKVNPPGWQEDIPWPSLDANPWPIHHGDAQFTGRSKYAGPQLGQVEWMIELPTTNLTHDSFLSPVVGDSTIYFVSYKDTASPGSFLYALRFDGSIKWTFPLPSPTQKNSSPPVLASDGTIYVATWGDKLFAVNPDGTMKWEVTFAQSTGIYSMMNLDKEGNLYAFAHNGVLYKFSKTGETVWSLTLDDFGSSSSAVVFSPDGNTMYVTNDELYAVSLNGELKWRSNIGSVIDFLFSTPLVDVSGIIHVQSGFSKINSIGERLPYYGIPDSLQLVPDYIDPTIDKKGNAILGASNHLISFTHLGEFRWSKSYALNAFFSLISDVNGCIYFLFDGNKIGAVDSLGNEKWQLQLDGQSLYSPAISSEGRIYLGTVRGTKKYFYSIK